MRKRYGLKESKNPMLSVRVRADLYRLEVLTNLDVLFYVVLFFLLSRSLPVEVLHIIVLGACKYLLQDMMSVLSARQNEEVLARLRAFNTSGFKVKMYGNVCCHYKSFVGREVGSNSSIYNGTILK